MLLCRRTRLALAPALPIRARLGRPNTRSASVPAGDESLAVEEAGDQPPAEDIQDDQQGAAADGQQRCRLDHVERDHHRYEHRWETCQDAKLLSDPDVARTRRDRDGDPDRPAGEERREQELREQVRRLHNRRGNVRRGLDLDDCDEEREDRIGNQERWQQRRERFANEKTPRLE